MFKTISGNIYQTVKWQRKSTKDFEAFEFTVTGRELIRILTLGSWVLSGLLLIIIPAVMIIVEPELINSHSKLETNAMYTIMVAGVLVLGAMAWFGSRLWDKIQAQRPKTEKGY